MPARRPDRGPRRAPGPPGSREVGSSRPLLGGYLVMAYAARIPTDRAPDDRRLAAPKIQDTVFLFKNIYPRRWHARRLAFAVELGDEARSPPIFTSTVDALFSPAAVTRCSRGAASSASTRKSTSRYERPPAFDLTPELPKFRFPTLVATAGSTSTCASVRGYPPRDPGSESPSSRRADIFRTATRRGIREPGGRIPRQALTRPSGRTRRRCYDAGPRKCHHYLNWIDQRKCHETS